MEMTEIFFGRLIDELRALGWQPSNIVASAAFSELDLRCKNGSVFHLSVDERRGVFVISRRPLWGVANVVELENVCCVARWDDKRGELVRSENVVGAEEAEFVVCVKTLNKSNAEFLEALPFVICYMNGDCGGRFAQTRGVESVA